MFLQSWATAQLVKCSLSTHGGLSSAGLKLVPVTPAWGRQTGGSLCTDHLVQPNWGSPYLKEKRWRAIEKTLSTHARTHTRTHTHSLMIWVPQTKTLMKTQCSFSPGSQPSMTVNSAPYTHCDTLEAAPLSCPRTKQRQDLAWALGSVYLLT